MDRARGTVTAISSEYSPEETQTAAKRVEDSISGRQHELERLRGFISDNANLINLVKRLGDQLHHPIMVPFGKAAFFPGRLVHTNEFLVLLGESYYVETTSKQTVEILKRRAKSLDSQVSSLNAVLQDLEAEASFFRSTASESAEGILEIREEYVEDSFVRGESESESLKQVSSTSSKEDKKKVSANDDEFSRIMSRLDELEKEEQEAESNYESDEDEQTEADLEGPSNEMSHLKIEHIEKPESKKTWEQTKNIDAIAGEIIHNQHRSDFTDELNMKACTGLTANPIPTEEPQSVGELLAYNTKKSVEKYAAPATMENEIQPFPSSSQQPEQAPIRTSGVGFDSQKAFTGSIVERADNLETASRKHTSSQTSSSQSSKPVSRFKMLRK